jgi:hypothetical protein
MERKSGYVVAGPDSYGVDGNDLWTRGQSRMTYPSRLRPSSRQPSTSKRRKALELTVPPDLLVAADEVIE